MTFFLLTHLQERGEAPGIKLQGVLIKYLADIGLITRKSKKVKVRAQKINFFKKKFGILFHFVAPFM